MGFFSRLRELTHAKELLTEAESNLAELKAKSESLNDVIEEQSTTLKALDDKLANRNQLISEVKELVFAETEEKRSSILDEAKNNGIQIRVSAQKEADEIIENAKEEIEETANLRGDIEQLQKEIKKYTRQARKYESDILGIKQFMKQYPDTLRIDFDGVQEIIDSLDKKPDDANIIAHILALPLHSDNSKELRKLSNGTKKQVEQVLEKYDNRYTTKANKTIYRLMVMSLRAEMQLLLFNLTYNSLDTTKESLHKILDNYIAIVADGNKAILPTETRFIAEITPLYENLIDTEYRYYVYRQREKEEQRALKEQMRQEAEERKALEVERKRLDKEESKFRTEIERNEEQLNLATNESEIRALKEHLAELQKQVDGISDRREEVTNLAMGKAGYVYVISNVGSFGDHRFKIGMTRRLEPQQRIDELGSASVPFKFDVHALIFSEDAVGLETELHQQLANRRVNKVNYRKEFFDLSIDELQQIVDNVDPTAEFNRTMLAEEYRQSLAFEQNQVLA